MNLVIVESPTKSKTISRFLGPQYRVLASYGHIRDLPEDEFGIDIKNDFQPNYTIIPKAKKNIQVLKKESEKAELVILATDEDREGEAIAYHLTYVLNLNDKKPYQRIAFHEITKPAIKEALENPREIDMNLVNSQQARRILDRIVGYKLSPFLWKKVTRGLSAGRVQSVAVRFIAEREKEIQNFIPQEYWTIVATLLKIKNQKSPPKADPPRAEKVKSNEFEAILTKKEDKVIPKLGIKTKKEGEEILKDLKGAEYKVASVEEKEMKRNPPPPFTTSTLQQTAWQKFRFPAKFTMRIAQQLYEKGYITYHRSDSLNLSDLALGTTKKFITENFGQDYYQFRKFKTKSKSAQEAHEAIRPTDPFRDPSSIALAKEDKTVFAKASAVKLYDLIWRRFIACQMKQAIFDSTIINISAKNYIFQANGQILRFDGFLKIYPIKFEEAELPPLKKEEVLELKKLTPLQHFTQPPNRYSEAALIKTLEAYGIGRPSTYAPILETIQDRGYVKKDEKKLFCPTEIGILVNDILVQHFPKIVDINFTATIEEDLDKIANAQTEYLPVIKSFYTPFEENLKQKYKEVKKSSLTQETNNPCPDCGKKLVIRTSKYGKFYACSDFPKCKYKKDIPISLGVKCPKCKNGEIVERRTKKRTIFYGCSKWPECDFALWDRPTGESCPKCGALIVKTRWGKLKCSNTECTKT